MLSADGAALAQSQAQERWNQVQEQLMALNNTNQATTPN
jgi:hypothetical protein